MMDDITPTGPNGIPVAPSMDLLRPTLLSKQGEGWVNSRFILMTVLSLVIALAASLIAQALVHLIGFITNLSFYGRSSFAFVSPAGNHLGLWVIAVPMIGGVLVGLMARYGHTGIRGHGIPEAMEQVLTNQSKIAPSLTFLKPISAAISIGTGGPFGAEGPIIATGGALGSVIGQLLKTTAEERKILLAVGAAAGMAATFGSPLSAVLLAIDFLLFEFRARSYVPVALGSAVAAAVRIRFSGVRPIFFMSALAPIGSEALFFYVAVGALVGLAAVGVTKAVYFVEDTFERLPIHWMWWPLIGGVAVGIIGYLSPHTLGVGYDNIEQILSGTLAGKTVFFLCIFKFISWALALGSGTSGGTLAPLFTIGGGMGAVIGVVCAHWFPQMGIDPRIAALVGMAALFAGASRALLTSIVFAFETTGQPLGLLPLIGGCSVAYLISSFLMKYTIMTEKIARRGVQVPTDYAADPLARVLVKDILTPGCITLNGNERLETARLWLTSGKPGSRHQGFPILDERGQLIGVLTHRDLMDLTASPDQTLHDLIRREPVTIFSDNNLRDAADLMVQESFGRLPVVDRAAPKRVIGIISRSDLLSAQRQQLSDRHKTDRIFRFRSAKRRERQQP